MTKDSPFKHKKENGKAPGLSAYRLVTFASAPLGYAFYVAFIQFYFLKFSTDVLLLAPAIMGLLLGPGRIWDAISDPIIGYMSDRTQSKHGRRRPWLFAGIPLVALSFILVWMPPAGLQGTALIAWLGISLFLFYTCFTVYYVPYMSFAAELSSDYHERSKLFGSIRIFHLIGSMAAFAGLQMSDTAAEPRTFVAQLAIAAAIICSVFLLVPPLLHRERQDYQGRGAKSPVSAFRDVWRNPHARLVIIVLLIDYIGFGIIGAITPYFAQYVLLEKIAGYSFGAYAIGGILGVPLWIWISRHLGKKNTWITAMLITAAAFGSLMFISEGQRDYFFIALFFAGAGGNAAASAVGQSILADVIDYDEYKTGERKEGAYSATWGFALKMGYGIVVVMAGFALQSAGYKPNMAQTETAATSIRLLMSLFPAVVFLLGALVFTRFSLNRSEHKIIQDELLRRKRMKEA